MQTEYIYKITCIKSNKVYVGRTCNVSRRKREHFKKLSIGKHSNKHLQNSYDKYGKDFFLFEVIEETTTELIKSRELFWFNELINKGVVLFNHDITSSSGGVDSKSAITRTYVFDVLTQKHLLGLSARETNKQFKIAYSTYSKYIKEWEELTGFAYNHNKQVSDTLDRIALFVKDLKKDSSIKYTDYGVSHQSIVKHLPKFGLSYEDVRLDKKFKTTEQRAIKAIQEVEQGKHFTEACKANEISIQTYYKYLKQSRLTEE